MLGLIVVVCATSVYGAMSSQCQGMGDSLSDTDMSGDLLAEVGAQMVDDCCPLCRDAEGCEGFAFLDHRCYLKANFSGTYHQVGVISRIASSTLGQGCSSFGPVQRNRDLAGTLLEDWYAPTPDLCCASCSRKRECQGFAYLHSRCYLKGDVTGTYENSGCLVHLKENFAFSSETPTPPPGTALPPVEGAACPDFSAEKTDTDMAGDLISERWAQTSDDCCPLCSGVDGCQGFAFFHHTCYLKGNFSGTYTQAGVFTRLITSRNEGMLPMPSSCPEFEPEAVDSDMSGDLITQRWAATSNDCCSMCQEFDECEGFVFFAHMCYLKKNFSGLYYHLGAITRITSHVARVGIFESALPDQDLTGDTLQESFAPTQEYCGASCARKPQCQGFVFLSSRCYLKGNVTGTYDNSGRVTRVKRGVLPPPTSAPQCPSFVSQARDTDMSGDLIRQSWVATVDACCTLCEEVEVCEGFAYFDHKCYLKKNFSGVYYHLGAITRITTAATRLNDFEPAQSNHDLVGKLLEEWFAPLPELCMASCARKPECEGFVFHDNRCYLKASVEGFYDNPGRIAGVKQGVLPPPGSRRLSDSSVIV